MNTLHFAHWPADLPTHITLPRTPVHDNLAVSARRYPDKVLCRFYDSPLAYGEAWRQVEALAGFLQRRCGVARGDRVLLVMQNSPQFVLAYYAILRADAMVVPVNPMNLTEELRHYVADSDAKVAFTGQELHPRLAPLLGAGGLEHVVVAAYSDCLQGGTDLPLPEACAAPRAAIRAPGVTLWADALDAGLAPGPSDAGPDDLCVMPYTSGTTGLPKGCVHTHASVTATLVAGNLWFRAIPEANLLSSLPFFHVTGMQGCMNGPIYAGASITIMQRWDRDTAARLIERYRLDAWTNISTMAIDFLANPRLDDYDLSSLRRIGGGGAAMPEAVAGRLHALTGLSYIEGYGLSETIGATHINPPQHPKRQCLGIPIFGVDARVVDPDTLAELPQGETGEIVVSGPQVLRGYWKKPEADRAVFFERDGKRFFRTGDLGRMDEEGYFFITDRLKRMINAAGFKVWPAEVEALLYRHPDVLEACIVGTPDARTGETVKAVVVLRAGRAGQVSAEDIVAWARQNMAAYKVPRVIEFAESLPKSATGKVQWRALQEREFAARQ
jgi:fatty-acyl-CoA synthase